MNEAPELARESPPLTPVRPIDPFDPPKAHLMGFLLSLLAMPMLSSASSLFPDGLFFCLAAWILISKKRANTVDAFGLRSVELGALALPVALALIIPSAELLILDTVNFLTHGSLSAWSELFPSPVAESRSFLTVLSVSVVVPVTEEMFFRGFFQGALRGLGLAWSVMLPSIMFALWHHPIAMPGAFAVAVVAGLLTSKHRSILPAVVFHAGVNSYLILLSAVQDRYHDTWGFAAYLCICVSGVLFALRIRPELSRLWAESKLAWREFWARSSFGENSRHLFRHWSYLVLGVEICLTLVAIVLASARGEIFQRP